MGEQKLATDFASEQKATTQVFLPEVINTADIWANTYYPQMWGAKDLRVGVKALELILNGDLTWTDFTKLKLSPDQLGERLEVVNKATSRISN